METARTLIKEVLDLPVLLDTIADDQDLVSGGVNSGEVVRIALRCEQYLDRALTDDELAGLGSVRAIAELLEGKGR
ncbi:phosphopantetheine-binding protein [Kitasatospora sp. NPDC093558]|uniref:phosphopantetheine-binding protein n=1 Tax=Kitasatospora sp. NPDC093558 TaxID=3155201 RepID=UPI00342EF47C